MNPEAYLEEAAFRAFQVFIRNGAGSLMPLRDASGAIMKDAAGRPIPESYEQCIARRWRWAPQATRDEFINYAKAMEPVFHAAFNGDHP